MNGRTVLLKEITENGEQFFAGDKCLLISDESKDNILVNNVLKKKYLYYASSAMKRGSKL